MILETVPLEFPKEFAYLDSFLRLVQTYPLSEVLGFRIEWFLRGQAIPAMSSPV